MYGQRRHLWQAALFLTILPFLVPIAQAQQPAPDAGITIQASGPIHEAYAEPTDGTAQPGLVVPRQPPDPIPEEPPDQKPEGDNVVWIPGYWAWDAVKNDFLWVSGFWRIPPPGQRWVPGYWTQVDNGWQWVPGFWTAADQQEVPYLPPPPADVDNGPSVPAPNADTIYVPGCWVYRAARYLWRPGFWLNCRPGWIWSRAHYCWSPRGHVFVDGYWDRALEDRGLLFAPVSFSTPLWNTPGWVYRPSCAVNVDNLLGSLFVRPAYSHYYFGDYYGAAYDRLGFQPWFTHGPRVHDPLFGYYAWQNRGNPNWHNNLRGVYEARREGRVPRPARTLREQDTLLQRFNGNRPGGAPGVHERQALRTVTPLHQFQSDHIRLGAVSAPQRAQLQTATQAVHRARQERLRTERPVIGKGGPGPQRPEGSKAPTLKLPPAGHAAHLGGNAPPQPPHPAAHPGTPSQPARPGQAAHPQASAHPQPPAPHPQAPAHPAPHPQAPAQPPTPRPQPPAPRPQPPAHVQPAAPHPQPPAHAQPPAQPPAPHPQPPAHPQPQAPRPQPPAHPVPHQPPAARAPTASPRPTMNAAATRAAPRTSARPSAPARVAAPSRPTTRPSATPPQRVTRSAPAPARPATAPARAAAPRPAAARPAPRPPARPAPQAHQVSHQKH